MVIVNSKFLKFYSKAKGRTPAHSQVLPYVRGFVQRFVKLRSNSSCQRDQRGRGAVKVGSVEDENPWKAENWMNWGRNS